jgi:hypothetical protein
VGVTFGVRCLKEFPVWRINWALIPLLLTVCTGCASINDTAKESAQSLQGTAMSELQLSTLQVKPMEAWYAMNDEHGTPQGYAHLTIRRAEDQTTEVSWQLRLAFTDGTYEEERSLVLNRQMKLLSAAYSAGQERCQATRVGDELRIFTSTPNLPEPQESKVPVAVDALMGLDFVLAMAMPLQAGCTLAYSGLNEANGFKSLGPASLEVKGKETIQWLNAPLEVWKVERIEQRGTQTIRLPIWVDTQGRIIQVDWGGGTMMVLSRTPTQHLFQPPKP